MGYCGILWDMLWEICCGKYVGKYVVGYCGKYVVGNMLWDIVGNCGILRDIVGTMLWELCCGILWDIVGYSIHPWNLGYCGRIVTE